MQPGPFRTAVGDVRACLDHLCEADRLLDAAPRTADAERAAAASDRTASTMMIGGIVGVAIAAAAANAGDGSGTATPSAALELGEAVARLQKAAAELGEHPGAAQLSHAIAQYQRAPVSAAAKGLASVARQLHPSLRSEFGLADVSPLANWNVTDAEDTAALEAAGLGSRKRAIKIVITAVVVVGAYVLLFSS